MALLNSKLYYLWFYFKGKRKGELLELYYKPLTEVPIKKIEESRQLEFVKLVEKILYLTSTDNYLYDYDKQGEVIKYQMMIDKLVYQLYGLTPQEIEIVEKFNKG